MKDMEDNTKLITIDADHIDYPGNIIIRAHPEWRARYLFQYTVLVKIYSKHIIYTGAAL